MDQNVTDYYWIWIIPLTCRDMDQRVFSLIVTTKWNYSSLEGEQIPRNEKRTCGKTNEGSYEQYWDLERERIYVSLLADLWEGFEQSNFATTLKEGKVESFLLSALPSIYCYASLQRGKMSHRFHKVGHLTKSILLKGFLSLHLLYSIILCN